MTGEAGRREDGDGGGARRKKGSLAAMRAGDAMEEESPPIGVPGVRSVKLDAAR